MPTALFLMIPIALHANPETMSPSDTGSYFPFLDAYAQSSPIALSFLSGSWPDVEQWRQAGRAKMAELLAYAPPGVPPDAETLASVPKDGYTRHHVRISIAPGRKTEGYLLIPDGLTAPAPAILALHDHSGFYYFGKEKVVAMDDPPPALQELIENTYGGRTVGDELARRGYVVFAPDAFYFGSQRLDPASLPAEYAAGLEGKQPGSDDYIRAFNPIAGRHEPLMAKTIFTAGATWPGIQYQGDKASLDYLLSRSEVDPERVGCIGLSLGGYRSAHTFGLDPRVKAGVVAGWMCTYRSLLRNHVRHHTWMIYVPGQYAWLDLPDVVTLNAPRPFMMIHCSQDHLFPAEGAQEAAAHIAEVYERMGAPDRFVCNYYNEPHSLKVPAQDDAIAWFERWLK
ncbi:MAG: dienelactone hydrolase family protein [Candidatus Hydrogenedentes bacterium]|nr:dienelactone hydrolase family protein [Candidatus Hydrogenedentota bacterium]